MIKPIILIISCKKDKDAKNNQAVFDTWISEWVNQIPYKFILGCGNVREFEDEVVVNAPDDLSGVAEKLKQALIPFYRNYSHFFICFPDTYVNVPRLLKSDFASGDYIGNFESHRNQSSESGSGKYYAHGGCGYWVSNRLAQLLIQSEVNHPSDDVWTGTVAAQNRVQMLQDSRYTETGNGLCTVNDGNITVHLSEFAPNKEYNKKQMYETHRLFKVIAADPKYQPESVDLKSYMLDQGQEYQLRAGTKLWTPRDLARSKVLHYSTQPWFG